MAQPQDHQPAGPSILEQACGQATPTADTMTQAISRASNGDWRAAAWVLEHHPDFREQFSDAGYERRAERRVFALVVEAIAAAGFTPQQERRFLLELQARGLGLLTPGGSPDD